MNHSPANEAGSHLILDAETAADLMVPNPVVVRHDATVQEAIGLLTDSGWSAAAAASW